MDPDTLQMPGRNGAAPQPATAAGQNDEAGAPRLAVIGASAGGVEALTSVARSFTATPPLAMLVVLHMPAGASSRLAEIIGRAGMLPATQAENGAPLRAGRILVAPPDRHVMVSDDRVFLLDGPRENGFRPAIDPMFRSAARTYGPRAVGVLLSGTMDDGVSGLAAIQAVGGAVVVQDPADAIAGGLPAAALEVLTPDHVAPASRIGPILAALAERPVSERVATANREAEALLADPNELPAKGADVTCPDCGGALQTVAAGPIPRYRCRVGHVFAPVTLLDRKGIELEAALWAAVRTLEESASVSGRLAERSRENGATAAGRRFAARQVDAARRADIVRQAIQSLDGETINEATEEALSVAEA